MWQNLIHAVPPLQQSDLPHCHAAALQPSVSPARTCCTALLSAHSGCYGEDWQMSVCCPLGRCLRCEIGKKTLLGCSKPPTILMLQVLCALVAHDDSKQRWLRSAGVLQLLERLLQSNSAGPEASDELSLYLVSLLLSHRGLLKPAWAAFRCQVL